MQQHFRIVGTGGYLPQRAITAEELDLSLGLSQGWTRRHTGVATRYQRAPGETATDMGCVAARMAVASAGLCLSDLDLIIDASTCQQQPIPSNAALLQEALGSEASGSAAFDVHASCVSFVVALATVNAFFAAGMYRHVLIVSSETPLDGVNWSDPASACLMGEGAAAMVVSRRENPLDRCVYRYQTFGELAHICEVAGGGHRLSPFVLNQDNAARYRFSMDGPKLHKTASRLLPSMVESALQEAKDDLSTLHVVPHQASGPAVALLARRLRIRPDRLHTIVADHGNLVAAGIPFALHHRRENMGAGERVMLIGTAAGYSQAVFIFTL